MVTAGCAVLDPAHTLAPKALTPHEPTPTALAHARIADAVAAGRVQKVEEDWEYGTTCPFPTKLQGCREQSAYRVEVKGERTWHFWAFPPPGNYLPIAPGMEAVFLLMNVWIVPYAKCGQMGQFATSCLRTTGEYALSIEDTLDILPLSYARLADSLWRTRR